MRITSRLYGLDSVVTTDYWMAYPTLHVSYAIDDRRELRLNYSLRVNRPEADALNPFPEYQNPLTLRVGNPYLKPEKIHSVEAGYQWKKGGTTILGTLYYRYVTNKLTPVTRYLANNVLLTTKENLNNGSSAGAELVLDAEIGKWATLDLSGNLFYDQIDATRLGYGNRKDAVAWSASLNANFVPFKNTLLQINSRYLSPSLLAQGRSEGAFSTDIGAKYEIPPLAPVVHGHAFRRVRHLQEGPLHRHAPIAPAFGAKNENPCVLHRPVLEFQRPAAGVKWSVCLFATKWVRKTAVHRGDVSAAVLLAAVCVALLVLFPFPILLFKQIRVLLSPSNHGVNDRYQRHAQRCDGILGTWGQFGIDSLGHQAVFYQFLQLHVKHAGRGFGECPVQFAWAQGAVAQLVQYAGLPFGVNQAHGQPQGAVQINGYLSFVHGFVAIECYICKGKDNMPEWGYAE